MIDLVFEVDEEILPEVIKIVRREMEGAIKLSVPLTVDVKVGFNWADMQKSDKWSDKMPELPEVETIRRGLEQYCRVVFCQCRYLLQRFR